MWTLINEALRAWRHHGLSYVIRTAPGHLVRRGRQQFYRMIFTPLTLDRPTLLSYCEARGRLWEIDEGTTFEMLPPQNTDVPARFEDLLGEHKIEPNFVCEITDARLVGPWAIPVTPSGKMIREPYGPMFHHILRRTFVHDGLISTLRALWSSRSPPDERELSGPLFHLVARHGPDYDRPNYGHWVNENLPQLRCLQCYERSSSESVKILINSASPSWIEEYLVQLGYDETQIIRWSGGPLQVSKLILPSLKYVHSFDVDPNPLGKQWARDIFLEKFCKSPNIDSPRRIYLSRQGGPRRMIENFDELRVLLSKYDFEIFRPESLTLLEELELFHNAEVILGVTGSNLAGIVFSTKSKLVEILPPEKHLIVYYTMSNELGMKYWYYNGESPVKNNNSIHENIAINIEEFDKFLSSVL